MAGGPTSHFEVFWDYYRKLVVPPGAGEAEVLAIRRAFYSGASAMYELVAGLREGALTGDETARLLGDLRRELERHRIGSAAGRGGSPGR